MTHLALRGSRDSGSSAKLFTAGIRKLSDAPVWEPLIDTKYQLGDKENAAQFAYYGMRAHSLGLAQQKRAGLPYTEAITYSKGTPPDSVRLRRTLMNET